MRYLSFFISEALIGMKRSGLMMFIAIVTITVSLVVFGFFLLLSSNMTNLADFISSRLEIRVFLTETVTRQDVEDFMSRVRSFEHVQSVSFVDRDTAWTQFKQNYSNIQLDDLVSNNPLPDTLKVVMTDNEHIQKTAEHIEQHSTYVSDVTYGGVIAQRMTSFAKWVRIGGFILVGFLTTATLFIIVNTIRLTIINRRDEVEIMSLVGATNAFISGPFMIEGLLMGSGSSLLAVVFLKFSYSFFAYRFQEALPYFPLVFKSAILNEIYIFVLLLGALLGVLGAYISISRILKKVI